MTLTKIKIYGPLRKFCNNQKSFEAVVKRPIDAFAFLKCNFKGLEKHMANQHYCIKVRGEEIREEDLKMNMEGEIQIIPVAHGNFIGIIIGIGMYIGGGALGGVLGSIMMSIGINLIMNSVNELLAPNPPNPRNGSGMDDTDPAAYASNYAFSGLANISRAGIPVNVVYGEILVGSITISNGIDVVQVKGD